MTYWKNLENPELEKCVRDERIRLDPRLKLGQP